MTNWIQKRKSELTSIKQLEQALMNRPDMRAALNRYITSLDLQGQINRNAITEQQALQLFRKAILDFSYQLNQKINERFTPEFIDENDLTNPLNMTQAINNPNSLASIQFDDIADSIILTLNEEAAINEQTQNQQQIIDQQALQDVTQEEAPTPRPEPTPSHEKEELLAASVLGVTLGKDEIEHTFEKYVGKELKNEFKELKEPDELKELEEIKSPFKIPSLKPEPPKTSD